MTFGKLILRKIVKIVAIRCDNLQLKCTKFDFHWGSVPVPTGGAYRPLGARREGDKRVWESREGREGR